MSDTSENLPRVERDPNDDHPIFFHKCSEIHPNAEKIGGKLPLGQNGWTWQEDGSLIPSIHCLECGMHGWWKSGGWVSV